MWKCSFSEEPVDLKLLCLKMMKKAGIILVATVVGALVLGGIYFLKETVFSPETAYQVVGETYIDYIPEEGYGISRVYITDEVWGSLAKSDAFIASIVEEVSAQGYVVSAEMIRDSIDASVVTDSCIATTTVHAKDGELAVAINTALQNAILDYCVDRQEIAESFIMTCPKEAEKRDVTKDVLVAALIGAVLGLVASVVVLLISFLMDDSVYLPVSFEKRYGIPMLGTLQAEELAANANKFCMNCGPLAIVGVCEEISTEDVAKIVREKLAEAAPENRQESESKPHEESARIFAAGTMEPTTVWLSKVTEVEGVILAVAAGRRDGKQIEKTIDFLSKQEVNIKAAVLCNADEALIAHYYKPGILKKVKKISAKKQAGDEA